MNGLKLRFAWRYLVSRKSHSVINIVSRISSCAVAIPVAAMVILLSVFNGFDGLIRAMYSEFDPDIAVTAARGKVFDADSVRRDALLATPGVGAASYVLEDNALLEYRGRQSVATVRGVDSMFSRVVDIEPLMVDGSYGQMFGEIEQAVTGRGLAYALGINRALYDPVYAYTLRRNSFSTLLPVDGYSRERIAPRGSFMLDAETDSKYMIVPLAFARRLFDYPGKVSHIMIRCTPGADPDKVRNTLSERLGDGFKVLTRQQQKASVYRMMKYEKWGLYLITLLVLVVASFSIVGSLVMLVIEKRDDISTLRAMGADARFVRGIFTREGMVINLLGATAGLLLGLVICLVQQELGVVKLPASTFLVDSYPVEIKISDIAAAVVSFVAVGYVITRITVSSMIPKNTSL